MNGAVAERLRHSLEKLSPQERRAARALLADYPRAGLGTSADLASTAGVSAPTVVRFARAMGFSGFADLQAALVAELADRRASPTTRFPETRGGVNDGHWLRAGVQQASADIRDSLTDIPQSEVDAAVALLADTRKRITCVGGRFSNLVAEYLALHLQQIRPGVVSRADTSAFGPAHTIDIDRRDVYVIYDMRRYQRSTVELARRLKDRGAQLIVITDPWLSPAAGVADIVLPTAVESASPFDSLAPAFVLSELLVGAVLEASGDAAIARIKQWDDAAGYEMLP